MWFAYKILEFCGPCTIKFVQWYASRQEKFQFTRVFKNIYHHEFRETEYIFYEAFDELIEHKIELESNTPLYSGSIGQIYKGIDKESNTTVAVKIRHPRIEYKWTFLFIKILSWLFNFINEVDVDGFMQNFLTQLDFVQEAKNMIKMRECFKHNENIVIPEPLYYSQDVIVMTWEDSVGINTIESRTEKYKYIMLMWLFNQDCVINNQCVHGDLHEGNWGIRDGKMIVYDFGLCICDNADIKEFVVSYEKSDLRNIIRLVVRRCVTRPNVDIFEQLENDPVCVEMANKKVNISYLLIELRNLVRKYNLGRIKSPIISFGIAYGIVEKIIEKHKLDELDGSDNNYRTYITEQITFAKMLGFSKLVDHFKSNLKKGKSFEYTEVNDSINLFYTTGTLNPGTPAT